MEEVALQLRGRTQVCGREARETSVKGLFVIILKDKDHYLEVEKVHTRALDQWLNIKSVLMSTMSSTELASDVDFNTLSLAICENARNILITQLREVSTSQTILYDNTGSPLLTVRSGEILFVFNCVPVQARIRKLDFCCEELGIHTGDNFQTQAYMAPVSKRMT